MGSFDHHELTLYVTSRPKRSRFCHIFLVQSLVWKYCLKLEGCLHNFFLIGPYSAAAEPNSAPKIVTQFLEPSLVLLRRFCLNVRTLRMPLNPRNHRCRYTLHSWSLVCYLCLPHYNRRYGISQCWEISSSSLPTICRLILLSRGRCN